MTVISQNKQKVASFEIGIWNVMDRSIVVYPQRPNTQFTFAVYETEERAKEVFEIFINALMKHKDYFDFGAY